MSPLSHALTRATVPSALPGPWGRGPAGAVTPCVNEDRAPRPRLHATWHRAGTAQLQPGHAVSLAWAFVAATGDTMHGLAPPLLLPSRSLPPTPAVGLPQVWRCPGSRRSWPLFPPLSAAAGWASYATAPCLSFPSHPCLCALPGRAGSQSRAVSVLITGRWSAQSGGCFESLVRERSWGVWRVRAKQLRRVTSCLANPEAAASSNSELLSRGGKGAAIALAWKHRGSGPLSKVMRSAWAWACGGSARPRSAQKPGAVPGVPRSW